MATAAAASLGGGAARGAAEITMASCFAWACDVQNGATQLTFASHRLDDEKHLLMPLWAITRWEGEPIGNEGQPIVWATAEELESYDMPPADVPLIQHVQRALADLESA